MTAVLDALHNDFEASSDLTTRPTSISPLSHRNDQIHTERKRAREAQEQQADKMLKKSKRVMTEANVGDNVTVAIPNVDRGRTDPTNLIGIIIKKDSNEMYQIAVKSGVLEGKFARNQFDICGYGLYSIEDMDLKKTLPLRKAVQEVSNCGGQGFVRCNCNGSNRCQTRKCKCFKDELKGVNAVWI